MNFSITLPITFGIGCEYPFNVYDRVRLLRGGIVTAAVGVADGRSAVALCSYTGPSSATRPRRFCRFPGAAIVRPPRRLGGKSACLVAALLILPLGLLLHLGGNALPGAAVRPFGA